MILKLQQTIQTKAGLIPYYQALLRKYDGNRNPAIIFTAHALTETSLIYCYGNNFGNIKPSYDAKTNTYQTSSTYPNGYQYLDNVSEIINGKEIYFTYRKDKAGTINSKGKELIYNPHQCAFLCFPSSDAFIDYKIDKFQNKWIKALEAAMKQDVTLFCKELKTYGYFTADLTKYTNLMFTCYKRVCNETDGL